MAVSSAKRRHKVRRRADMSLLGGIRPPIAVLSALLLALAGLTALGFGKPDNEPLPTAVRTSQQHFAEDGAIALRASLDESITDLNRTAALFNAGDPVSADTVLDKLGNVYQKWRGSAIVEITSGKLLAARGENVPLLAVDREKLSEKDGLAPRMVRLKNGETRLLTFALLSWEGKPQQLLITSNSLKVPGISLGKFRVIAVVDSGGTILSSDGLRAAEDIPSKTVEDEVKETKKQLRTFAKLAAEKSAANPVTTKEPGSGGFFGVSGTMTGSRISQERPVVGYATLAAPEAGGSTDATGLGLSVVTLVTVPENTSRVTDPLFGLVAAAALLVIGALAVALLLGTVQRPLIRLFLESRRLSRGDLTRPVTVPRFGEARRIGDALERLRLQLLGGTPAETSDGTDGAKRRRGRRVGTRALLAGGGILLLIWSAPMMLLLNRAGDTIVVPQQLVNDQRDRTDTLTDRVRRALNEGHADLLSVATLIGDQTAPADMATVLERTMTEHPRYRSLYVLSPDGTVLAKAGDSPQHPGGKRTGNAPIAVLSTDSKEPQVAGYAELPGRDGALVVGEFRVDFLNSLLKRPGLGQIRIVDAERRIVGANTGYRAFQKLPSSRLDSLVSATGQKVGLSPRPSGVLFRDGDGIQIAAAAPFAGGGAAKSLGWTVVSWQPASALAIPEYSAQNRTVLAGLLGVTAAAACLGWLHIVVVRPLRELARQAETLADGDRRTVLYPRHHDEVGAITRSLELLRQQLQEQRRREGAPSALAERI
ncbi:HAMP domain-containing protein [Streptomyces scopuliridis]|uniref:HAMP domain-containing protein n=1 Tax=Streptomyces scopuliridis TaxID=452529 RepID=A0ACD4ZMB0_9ACTN|nr:HAMP domain-containing protein [Streptomyces scopuliridis]WSB35297.1 HAMP domain-containing protein [Streptomyces scopuliridis]WSB99539.1 HAMP domain-containing protein [Streptomyces scopuliridis]WSC06761.1 HAMP domain-containing protein [Streptomyces scopuliridis]